MLTLNLDIETYSSENLKTAGVHRYTESPDFTILLIGYAVDGGDREVVDLVNGPLPQWLRDAITDPAVVKKAWNAAFERTCFARYLGAPMPPEQWHCTMAKAAQLSLPLSLDQCAKVLKVEQKHAGGKSLIKYFCEPCKPTKTNGGRVRNLPVADTEGLSGAELRYAQTVNEKWLEFTEYCRQDVSVEMVIGERLSFFDVSQEEMRLWCLDQRVNDRGICVDLDLVKGAIRVSDQQIEDLAAEAAGITGLQNPNSLKQLKEWLQEETGREVNTLNKETLPVLLKQVSSEAAKRVLEIRQQLGKSSVTKYKAMLKCVGTDGRIRGLLQYGGANRTLRWAGRLVQPQNLAKTPERDDLPDMALAREVVKTGDHRAVDTLFGNPQQILSWLVRTAFCAGKGSLLIPSDFSAIEARVIAWLAGEKWRIDVFETHGKIYEASASQMFKVPIESIHKGSDLRQRGKVSELALGYQGGPGALAKMGALKMGIPEEDLPRLVAMWRQANPRIVKLWKDVQNAAVEAIERKLPLRLKCWKCHLVFNYEKKALTIQLPSGRKLWYLSARVDHSGQFGPVILYEGMGQTTKQWGLIDTYGGKLVENIVQAVSRDLLAGAMLRLEDAGFSIVLHVHDEAVVECSSDQVVRIEEIMSQPVAWAPGLPLRAEAFFTEYYKKD